MEGAKTSIKGLQNFTEAVHRSGTIEKEKELVNVELAKIRKEFKEGRISSYDRRKCVLKMAYIHVLGYEVDTGFVEVIQLLGSPKFFDKQVGYLAFTLLFSNVPESTRMIINTLQQDLENNFEPVICDALGVIATLANLEMADTLGPSVLKLCTGFCETPIKKRAIIAVRELYKHQPAILNIVPDFMKSLEKLLSVEMDIGIINAMVLLLMEIQKNDPAAVKPFGTELVNILSRLVGHEYTSDIDYHETSHPWLQIHLLKFLSSIELDPQPEKIFWQICGRILNNNTSTKYEKACNEKTVQMSIVFEVMQIIIKNEREEFFEILLPLLSSLVEEKEVNIRYLALDTFVLLGQANYKNVCQKYLTSILKSLEEPDVTIRRRAIEVLYSLCTPQSVRKVVNHLLHVLEVDEGDLKEELVVKISILAEMDEVKDEWYVDTMLLATCLGGEFVRPELWDRVLQCIENTKEYCIQKIIQILYGNCWHEEFLRMSCVIIGEYPVYLGQFAQKTTNYIIKQLFYVGETSKRVILTCLVKIAKELPDMRQTVMKALKMMSNSVDVEVQQRAAEFINIMEKDIYDVAIDKLPERVYNEEEYDEEQEMHQDDDQFMRQDASQQQPQQQMNQQKQSSMSLFDMDGFNQQPQQPVQQQSQLPLETTPYRERTYKGSVFNHSMGGEELGKKVRFIHKKLLMQKEGVVYQDQNIQIGMRMKCTNVIDVALYIGNTQAQPLNGMIALKGEDGLNCLLQSNQINIEGKKQQQLLCRFELKQLFLQAPMCKIQYTIGGQTVQFMLSLPINVLRFATAPEQQYEFFDMNKKGMFGECLVQGQIQSQMQMQEIQQLLVNDNFKIVGNTQNGIVAGGMLCDTPVAIYVENNGGVLNVAVGAYKLAVSQVVYDCISYLVSNTF